MLRKKILLFLLLQLFVFTAKAQDSLAYGNGFRFRDGLYFTFQQFRSNHPLPKSKIVTNYDTTALDFFRKLVTAKSITYIDSAGKQQEINPARLWGFCENNAIYIRYNADFNRVVIIGSICHFTSLYTTYMSTGPTNAAGTMYGTPVENMQQYMIDMQTGAVLDYNVANLMLLLQRDKELYAEYMALRKSKRKKLMFLYLRKYNERNPLYFPL